MVFPSHHFISSMPLVPGNASSSLSFPGAVFFWGVISRVMGREGVRNKKKKSPGGRKVLSCGHEITENEDKHRQAFVAHCFHRLGNRYHAPVECLIPFIVIQVGTRSENGPRGTGPTHKVKQIKYGIWVEGPERK